MSFDLEIRNGLLWPKSDTELWKVARDYTVLEMALPYCKQRRVAIQAGGACGTFPLWLSGHFETVYTFEPDPVNFTCLVANCQRENVVKMQAALSVESALCGIKGSPGNAGAGYMDFKSGKFPALRFDFLPYVDLIQLDVEGMEAMALCGLRWAPVIIIEDKGLYGRYDWGLPIERLEMRGYREVASYKRDRIFTHAL